MAHLQTQVQEQVASEDLVDLIHQTLDLMIYSHHSSEDQVALEDLVVILVQEPAEVATF